MSLLHVTDICGGPGHEFVPADALHRGKYVHAVTDLLDKGKTLLEPIYEPWKGFIDAWANAKRELGITVVASEEAFEDERRGYCGKRDKWATMKGRRGSGIVDLKCNGSCAGTVPPTTGLQLAGYVGDAKLWRSAVALHPDGTYRWHDDRNNKVIFQAGDWREFCARLTVMQADIRRGWREAPAERED